MVDTTIPGVSAEIVTPDVARPSGTAGRIALVGIFERGDADTPYFFDNPRDALRVMGKSNSYPGSRMINYIFKQDDENNNYGASGLICVQAGARVKGLLQLKDASEAPVLLLTAKSGGLWANGTTGGLTATVAAGTVADKRLILKLGGVVVEDYDNCTNLELKNKINALSQFVTASATSAELAKTLADVTDAAFASGTDTASPTNDDTDSALNSLLEENFDILLFTNTPADAYYPTIEAYLNTRLSNDKPCISILPIDSTNTVSETIALIATADNQLMSYIGQKFTIGTDELTDAESAARYAGFVAGLSVNESPTNKRITDIDAISPEFTSEEAYTLTDKGLTCFELKNRETRKYGVISSVTGSQSVGDDGMKTNASELYAVRCLTYVLNYLNLDDWLGRVGISKTLNALEGELSNRKQEIIGAGIADELIVTPSIDSEDDKICNVDISVRPPGILKHIRKRIQLNL